METKLTYPIPHNECGGTLVIYGEAHASRIVIMCAGWPDDCSSFGPLAQRLSNECDCLVGVTCLPGYDSEDGWKDGYTFHECVGCLREAVKLLRDQSSNPSARLFGIFHDWGTLVGAMYTNRALQEDCKDQTPQRLVLLDVLVPPEVSWKTVATADRPILESIYAGLVVFAYQTVLAQCFLLQRYISKRIAIMWFILGATVLGWLHLVPASKWDVEYIRTKAKANVSQLLYMSYPYYYFWKTLFTCSLAKDLADAHLPVDLSKTPVLYMYGPDKPIQFHEPAWLEILRREQETPKRRSKVVEVERTGHWMYLEQADVCFQEISSFLQD